MLRRVTSAHSSRLSAGAAAAPRPPGVLYTPEPGAFDEAHRARRYAAAPYAGLLEALAETDLSALAEDVHADVCRHGIEFGGKGGPEPFRLDLVPRRDHRRGVGRARARPRPARPCARPLRRRRLRQAGDRRGGRPAGRVLESCDHFERRLVGLPAPPVRVAIAGLDLVRDRDGRFHVLEDNVRTPSGTTYTLAARETLDRHLPSGTRRASPAARRRARHHCRDPAGRRAGGGRRPVDRGAVSDGPSNSAWYEHERIARALSIPVVTCAELSVSGDRLIARVNGRRMPVDVVYRRTTRIGSRTSAASSPRSARRCSRRSAPAASPA